MAFDHNKKKCAEKAAHFFLISLFGIKLGPVPIFGHAISPCLVHCEARVVGRRAMGVEEGRSGGVGSAWLGYSEAARPGAQC